MPFRDGSGPLGYGPCTGRGLGPCGCSFARGRGFGRGSGWRRTWTKEDELKNLDDEARILKEELEAVQGEIKDLKVKK